MKILKRLISPALLTLSGYWGCLWGVIEEDVPFLWSDQEWMIRFHKEYIFKHQFWIFSLLILLCVGTALLLDNIPWNKEKPAVKSLLKLMHKELGNSQADKVRITLFIKTKAYNFWLKYLWGLLVNARRHIKKRIFWKHIKCFPIWGDILVIYTRVGNPHSKGTLTFFSATEHKDDVDSISSEIYQKEGLVVKTLPDLKGYFRKNKKNCKLEDFSPKSCQAIITKYMDLANIKSLDKLRTLHRRSRFFCGTPISNNENEVMGVLLIDSMDEKNLFESDAFQDMFLTYTRMIECVINSLN